MNLSHKYQIQIDVKASDIDELQHVNNMIYLSYLQEAATQHWYHLAPKKVAENIRWVVRKHEIEYFKPAKLGDRLTISTWVEKFTSISSLRNYEIHINDNLIVQANTLWVCLDAQTMKPKRLDKKVMDLFFE